ncbi:MAG: hypothetical protein HQL04_04700 [Nitrospirae bacterium]|nr:hypothetical protein [Nitrospirota bacterium]
MSSTAEYESDTKSASLEAGVSQDHEVMELVGRDREIFVSALLNPTLPSGKLKEAIASYKEIMD